MVLSNHFADVTTLCWKHNKSCVQLIDTWTWFPMPILAQFWTVFLELLSKKHYRCNRMFWNCQKVKWQLPTFYWCDFARSCANRFSIIAENAWDKNISQKLHFHWLTWCQNLPNQLGEQSPHEDKTDTNHRIVIQNTKFISFGYRPISIFALCARSSGSVTQ